MGKENRYPASWWRPAIATLACVAIGVAVLGHRWHLNADGPHWELDWQRLPSIEVYGCYLLAVSPLIAAQCLRRRFLRSALLLLMISVLTLQLAGVGVRSSPFSFEPLVKIIRSWGSISYHVVASQFVSDGTGVVQILRDFPRYMPHFPIHAREKPPGPVLYYYGFIRVFGTGTGATLLAGFCITLFTSLAVPAIYAMSRMDLEDEAAAFHAATCICLLPATMMFFPFFDPCYIVVLCLLYLTWGRWLRDGRAADAIAFGIVLAGITFWAYNVLVCGTLLLAQSMQLWITRGKAIPARFLRGALIAICILAAFYMMMFLTTRFDPIKTFRVAFNEQSKADLRLGRFYLNTMPTNLLGSAIGVGVGVLLAAGLAVGHPESRQAAGGRRVASMLIGLGQIALVAASGLLKSETDRVWMFLMPLVAIPAGWEISRWPPRWRAIFYVSCGFLAAACIQNMRTATFWNTP